jgi:histidinol-phosphate aminotransferase
LIPDVTYSFYRVYTQLYGIARELQPVNDALRIDEAALAAYVDFGGESALALVASYPIDRIASTGAIAALEDEAWFVKTRDAIIDTREGLALQLEDLGFEVLPSQANFVFARHAKHDAGEIAASLRAHAVFVRHFRQPRIDQFLRITVGTREQCTALLEALIKILVGR